MSRIDIDIDDELIAEAMRKFGLKTKEEAEGIGWDGDLDEMRASRVQEIDDRDWS